jgi:GH15 family glucan-1,4-alpha-glucosidase
MATRTAIPPLHHAAVGNGRILALVSPTSAVEWLCLPRMDSGSVFGRLLDREHGGTFRLLPGGQEATGALCYVPNTNVSRIRFRDAAGAWDVYDYAPRVVVENGDVYTPPEFVRYVVPRSGTCRLAVDFDPRPEYGQAPVTLRAAAFGIVVEGWTRPLHLLTNAPLEAILQRSVVELTQLERTLLGWQQWAKDCALPSFAPEAVLRSALALKLHIVEHTGAVMAAATTSIPEQMGTERTWDYRYCWLRDAAWVVDALRRLSFLREGERFIAFLRRVIPTGPLQPVYGIGGERDLPERMLDALAGFGGNGHVRIGNAAAVQRQNDLMGELVLCLAAELDDPRLGASHDERSFELITTLVEDAIRLAPEPDTGVWEYRTEFRNHTFSRAMCWAAIQRGARLARRRGRTELARRWQDAADREREVILARGYSDAAGYFTQGLEDRYADASNLLLPILGIVRADDVRMIRTVAAYERLLVQDGLMQRYVHADDVGVPTSTFTICSFWSTPTRSGCSRRTSTAGRGRCSATSRRRTRTWA